MAKTLKTREERIQAIKRGPMMAGCKGGAHVSSKDKRGAGSGKRGARKGQRAAQDRRAAAE